MIVTRKSMCGSQCGVTRRSSGVVNTTRKGAGQLMTMVQIARASTRSSMHAWTTRLAKTACPSIAHLAHGVIGMVEVAAVVSTSGTVLSAKSTTSAAFHAMAQRWTQKELMFQEVVAWKASRAATSTGPNGPCATATLARACGAVPCLRCLNMAATPALGASRKHNRAQV
jgi:hypothetical protein